MAPLVFISRDRGQGHSGVEAEGKTFSFRSIGP